MNVADHLDSSVAATTRADYACLAPPRARGLAAFRAHLVDSIKRAAIRHLHASSSGERFLLRMYLDAEEASLQLFDEELIQEQPAWLLRQARQHRAEERAHTELFAAALAEEHAARPSLEGLSRRKIARWKRLNDRYRPHFIHGALVPEYATLLCAEQMAMRIMGRHCETIGVQHPLYPLFARVLADEHRHVRLCAHTLQRLVAPHEADRLAMLLAEVRRIEAVLGVTGAVAIYAAGLFYRMLAALQPGAAVR